MVNESQMSTFKVKVRSCLHFRDFAGEAYDFGGLAAEVTGPQIEQRATLLDQAGANVSGCDLAMNLMT